MENTLVQNPPEATPRITPYLLYEDLDAAVDWLVRAFGFTERLRMKDSEGRTNHAELTIADGLVMMGSPGAGYRNPKRLGSATQLIYVYVDDVDQHYANAVSAGAHILREPADQFYGDRTYGTEDPEGHQWSFAQHVHDVRPDEMSPSAGQQNPPEDTVQPAGQEGHPQTRGGETEAQAEAEEFEEDPAYSPTDEVLKDIKGG